MEAIDYKQQVNLLKDEKRKLQADHDQMHRDLQAC